jgi:hypothetical protein
MGRIAFSSRTWSDEGVAGDGFGPFEKTDGF